WNSLTAVAVAVLLSLIGFVCWGAGWVIGKLSPVLLPIAVAGVIAYLLDPVVDYFQRKGWKRTWAILFVFLIGTIVVLVTIGAIVPRLFLEIKDLVDKIPSNPEEVAAVSQKFGNWLQTSTWGMRLQAVWDSEFRANLQTWASNALPAVSTWFILQVTRIASWFGLIVGLALVPVYVFYFLLEKSGIENNWKDYLPIQASKTKDEAVFILSSINDYLIVFFRGQVLVALCDGALLTVGFMAMGMNYALLLGMTAGLLSIVPFLGVAISLVPALAIAAIQFGDWLHPLMVLGLFGLVQMAEGLYISPKIIGDRVGLHPLTIIIAVMVGTTLMGGILGGILAIPLTAALRVLMFRYVWKRRFKMA
ncbi:MAG: AI-2E family transporter, partial [Verrucomicrobiales bacterium]